MVWETLERESDVVGLGGRMWQADQVEGLNSTPSCKSQRKGYLKVGRVGVHGNNPYGTSPNETKYAYWKRTNGGT
jgi:hypothetical protein